MPRTRKDIWKLAATDDTLKWYARAVGVMQSRPVTDPTSWRYQGAIHGYDPDQDPFAQPGEQLPSPDDQETFWSRCQHGSWFFFPWHRAYLHYFEEIVRKAIREDLKAPNVADTWALPYWNYSDPANPQARCLPPAFCDPKFPDGGPNPLRVDARTDGANDGQPLGKFPDDVELATCMKKLGFINSSGGAGANFGGGRTGFSHRGGVPGSTEIVPHGSMHDAVGNPGWMDSFETAALDPIFWIHHSNIDRLWEVWLRRDARHTNPTLAAWLSSIDFDFHDSTGAAVQIQVNQVLDTSSPLLDYVYEDVSDPIPAAPHALAEAAPHLPMEVERIPEMVGATENQEITLGPQPRAVEFAVKQPSGPAAAARAARPAGAGTEVHLNLENVTADERPIQGYTVYVNLPEGANPDNYPQLKAGRLPRFGIVEASRQTKEHAGDGMNYSFDITQVVNALRKSNQWDPAKLRVTFVPLVPDSRRAAPQNTKPVKVGRISLYYA